MYALLCSLFVLYAIASWIADSYVDVILLVFLRRQQDVESKERGG